MASPDTVAAAEISPSNVRTRCGVETTLASAVILATPSVIRKAFADIVPEAVISASAERIRLPAALTVLEASTAACPCWTRIPCAETVAAAVMAPEPPKTAIALAETVAEEVISPSPVLRRVASAATVALAVTAAGASRYMQAVPQMGLSIANWMVSKLPKKSKSSSVHGPQTLSAYHVASNGYCGIESSVPNWSNSSRVRGIRQG
jgi:hypothetical protein